MFGKFYSTLHEETIFQSIKFPLNQGEKRLKCEEKILRDTKCTFALQCGTMTHEWLAFYTQTKWNFIVKPGKRTQRFLQFKHITRIHILPRAQPSHRISDVVQVL